MLGSAIMCYAYKHFCVLKVFFSSVQGLAHIGREAFIRKNRKYIGLLPIWGYPPPLGGLVISGFFLGYFLSFSETLK